MKLWFTKTQWNVKERDLSIHSLIHQKKKMKSDWKFEGR